MYNVLTVLSIIDPFFAFFVGVYVFIKNPMKNLNLTFFIFTWIITVWSMLSYALYLNQDNFLIFKLNYSTGAACFTAIIPWVIYLVGKKNTKIVLSSYAASLLLFIVPFVDKIAFSNFTVGNNVYNFHVGFTYYIYAAIVFASIIYTYYLLLTNLKKVNPNYHAILLVSIGFSIFVFWEIVAGVLLPMLNIALGADLPFGSVGDTIVFVGLSAYGIVKYFKESIGAPIYQN